MSISNKIFLMIVFLLLALGANTFVGIRQLNNVQQEFAGVAHQDVALMEALTSITALQLEKNILLEKLIAIAEELGFEQPVFARAQYLNDQIKVLHEGFDRYTQLGTEAIKRAKQITAASLSVKRLAEDEKRWQEVSQELNHIETIHANYDQLISQMLTSVAAGGFQLSIDDIHKFKRQEEVLSKDLKNLLEVVQGFVRDSLDRSHKWQDKAGHMLVMSFTISALLSLLLAFWIIRRISGSLKDLTVAAGQVGQGNFVMNLKTSSRDEIAEVARAFNIMSAKLQEFTRTLEEQNKLLAINLEKISQQKEDLQKVNQELDRFVHTVSHDIVGPLTGITGYGAFLEEHYAGQIDQKGKDCISGVRRGAGRLSQLIKNLLELSQVSRVRNPYSEIAVKELIDMALVNCEYAIQQAKAQVIVHEPMPTIVCDHIKMTTVFYNLINNAVKYSAKKNPQGSRIEVGYSQNPLFHEFYVQDNGIGIDPAKAKDVFEIFKRLPEATEYEGSGAGLAIVKAAVEDQGGKIRVESQPGVGSKFIFTVPKNLTPYKPFL